jgi:hypothetical protein
VSHLSLDPEFHLASIFDLLLDDGCRLDQRLLHLSDRLLLNDFSFDFLLNQSLLLDYSLTFDFRSSLSDDDFFLSLILYGDLLRMSSFGLNLLKSSDFVLSTNFLFTLYPFFFNWSNGLKSISFSHHSSWFFLHHSSLSRTFSLFSCSFESLSLLLSSDSFLLFSLSLLLFNGFRLFSLHSLLLEILLFHGFLFFGLIDLAGATGVFFLTRFLFHLLSLLGGSGRLDDRDLGIHFALDGCGSLKHNCHGGLDHCSSPLLLNPLNIFGLNELLMLVAEALFHAIRERISHFKARWNTLDALGTVGVVYSEREIRHFLNIIDFVLVIWTILSSKCNITITEASFPLISAWIWLVLRSWLTPALFGSFWPWITSHTYGWAHSPVICVFIDGLPLSHIVKFVDGLIVIWSI